MMNLRIGFISSEYGISMGGVGNSAQRIAKGLQAAGNQVIMVVLDSSRTITSIDYLEESENDGVKVFHIGPFTHSPAPPEWEVEIPSKIKSLLRRRAADRATQIFTEHPVDCLISFDLLIPGIIPIFLSRLMKVPVVCGIRGSDIGLSLFDTESFPILGTVIEGADAIISVNAYMRDRMLLMFPGAAEKTTVVRNGFSAPELPMGRHESRKRILEMANWKDSDLILVFSGSMREAKGLITVVQLLGMIAKEPIKLLVVGPNLGRKQAMAVGKYWEAFKANGQIYVTGQLEHHEALQWVIGGDIIFFPSTSEGIANGLLEGMALGLCPLVSHVLAEVVTHQVDGWVVPSRNPELLKEALLHLNENRDLVRHFGEKAKVTIANNFRPEEEIAAYQATLERLCRERQ